MLENVDPKGKQFLVDLAMNKTTIDVLLDHRIDFFDEEIK
jgi:hypothetical protein